MFGTRERHFNLVCLRVIGKAVVAENWANCKSGFNESANFKVSAANEMI